MTTNHGLSLWRVTYKGQANAFTAYFAATSLLDLAKQWNEFDPDDDPDRIELVAHEGCLGDEDGHAIVGSRFAQLREETEE